MTERDSKLDLKALFADEGAVSPVIGVILMVAITVILAAVIGTFVLGLGNSAVQSNAQAGVSFSQDASGNVTVTLTSLQRADAIYYNAGNGTQTLWSSVNQSDVGSSQAIGNFSSGTQIKVIGELNGQRSTVSTYTVN